MLIIGFLFCNILFAQNLELSHDVVIFKDPHIGGGHFTRPTRHATIYAQVGSLRLAQKLGLKVGDIIAKGINRDREVIQKVIDLLGRGGKILFKPSNYGYFYESIRFPRPSYFILEGERYRFGSTYFYSRKQQPIDFKKPDSTKPTILEIKNIFFLVEEVPDDFHFKIPKDVSIIFHGVGLSVRHTTSTMSGFYFEKDETPDIKIIEYYQSAGKTLGILYDFESSFVTGICPEGYHSEICSTKFGPGGLLIGGHHGFGAKPLSVPAVSTYKLPSEELRKSYPSTVIGLGYECGWTSVGYRADGAHLILLNASITGPKKLYEEINGGKVIAIGVK